MLKELQLLLLLFTGKVGDTIKYIAGGTALNSLTSLSEYKIASVPSTTSFAQQAVMAMQYLWW